MRHHSARSRHRRQHGASLVEAIVVFPIFIFTVLAIMQAAMVYYTKSNVNYAAFGAARAGSPHNASVASIKLAFEKAMIPDYGGGTTEAELAKTLADVVKTDLGSAAVRVEILSPTQESFADYSRSTRTARPRLPWCVLLVQRYKTRGYQVRAIRSLVCGFSWKIAVHRRHPRQSTDRGLLDFHAGGAHGLGHGADLTR
jgi:hypothetical protein